MVTRYVHIVPGKQMRAGWGAGKKHRMSLRVPSLHWTSPTWVRVIYICVVDSILFIKLFKFLLRNTILSSQIVFLNCNHWQDYEPLFFCHTLKIMLIFSVFEHINLTTAMEAFTNRTFCSHFFKMSVNLQEDEIWDPTWLKNSLQGSWTGLVP